MKKYLSILIISFLPCLVFAGVFEDSCSIIARKKASTVDSYTSHIVARYRAENNTNDSVGGNDLTPNDTITYNSVSPLEGSYSIDFESTAARKATRTDANLDAGFPGKSGGSSPTSFTIMGEIKGESWPDIVYPICKYDVTNDKRTWAVKIDTSGDLYFSIGYSSGTVFEDTTHHASALSAGTNYKFAIAYNTSTKAYRIRLYQVGTGVLGTDITSTTTEAMSITDSDFCIGTRSDGFTGAFDGLWDDFVICNAYLTTTQMDEYFAE